MKRLVSWVLLVAGVALVFAGFSAALGFSPGGITASLAAVASLLYAGATWFTAPRAAPAPAPLALLVFDTQGRIVAGDGAGEPVTSRFPEMLRPEIDRRCRAALAGTGVRFPCLQNGELVVFDALPVRSADGAIVYGLLVRSEPQRAPVAASA